MEPKGVRLACPDCTFSVVMTSEDDMPTGIRKKVEGVPYCPNCDLAMRPTASVDVTPKPNPGIGEGLSFAERLEKIRLAEQEVAAAERDWDDAKDDAARCKKVYDGRVESLRTLITRLTSVAPPADPKPLLDAAEAVCNVEHERFFCSHVPGHEGPHEAFVDGADVPVHQWPNELEAIAGDGVEWCADSSPDGGNGDEPMPLACSRPKGHQGAHVAHTTETGNELRRWPQVPPQTILETAVETAAGDFQQRSAKFGVMVTLDEIDRWTVDQYDEAMAWLTAVESGGTDVPVAMPSFMAIATGDGDGGQESEVGSLEPEPEPEPEPVVPIETGRRRRAAKKDREPVHA